MPRLVPIDAEGTPAFVDALQRAWDAGDAVLPVDPRLPKVARERLLADLRAGDQVEPGDALVVATSGTTGEPRGAVLTHAAVAAAATATSARLAVDPGRDRWLACLPLAHVGGLGVVTRALHTGTPLTLLPRPDPGDVAAAARAGATLVSLVPTVLARVDAGWFRTIVLGGAAPPPRLPPNVVTTYGMTETGGGVVYDGTPLDGAQVRIVDGEIHVRGPMLLRAYRDGSDPTGRDRWLPTGDAGGLDAAGRLEVHGRLDDVIVTGAEKVWPDPVEAALTTHPGVAEAAVAGRPDAEWGQRVVAWVVPADPCSPPTLDELRDHVRAWLPAWAAPRQLVLTERLPRTTLGKVRRKRLE